LPEEQLAFDPWGKRRDEAAWSAQADLTAWFKSRKPITSRGFTGHEMIDGTDIIHMNGRIYDSHIARFLQSDPLIQDPTVSGSLNRYSYVWNNPLNTIDPSGYAGFKQDQEEQKRAQTRTCSASSCSYRDADGNWVSGGFGSTMDLSGGSAATHSASVGGALENSASAGAGVTMEINQGQSASSGGRMAIVTTEEIDPETGAVTSVSVSGTMMIARSFAWNAQVTSLISNLGTELRSLAVLGGRYATGIVGGVLIPDSVFGEDFGCHSSMVTCVVDGKVVDASTGLPYEGGMVSSGGGFDPGEPDDEGKLPKHLRNKIKRINNQTAAGGNQGVSGSVSQADALRLGREFVGPGFRTMSNGQGYVSSNGLRVFRFPNAKRGINPNTGRPWSGTGRQVNFETKATASGRPISNVHLDVLP
jgi:RHS repeat-associated protein